MRVNLAHLRYHFTLGWKEDAMMSVLLDQVHKGLT